MSKFRKIQNQLEELAKRLDIIEQDLAVELETASNATTTTFDEKVTATRKQAVSEIQAVLDEMAPILEKMALKAAITDVDLQIYGESMCKRILTTHEIFLALNERAEAAKEGLLPSFQALDEKLAADVAAKEKAQAEAEEAKRKEQAEELRKQREEREVIYKKSSIIIVSIYI